ncbi:hypothetical protein NFI96_000391 [Prochilodus magdalenae]|nr:hypothetical protein NFI96_000391 [Prochilodus magdalenae]
MCSVRIRSSHKAGRHPPNLAQLTNSLMEPESLNTDVAYIQKLVQSMPNPLTAGIGAGGGVTEDMGVFGLPLKLRCDVCSVVSSSGQMLGRQAGHEIERSSCVWRMNIAPTRGFELDVGRRTDLRVVSHTSVPLLLQKPQHFFGQGNETVYVVWGPLRNMRVDGKGIVYNMLRQAVDNYPHARIYVTTEERMNYCDTIFKRETGKDRRPGVPPPPPLPHHLQELCEDVQAAWDGLSQDTIRNLYSSIPRRLCSTGLHRRHPYLKRFCHCNLKTYPVGGSSVRPFSPRRRHQRLQWCSPRLSWSDSEWRRVIFSDESRFCLGGDAQRIRVWRHRGQHQDERFGVTRPEDLVSLHLHPYRTICRNCVRMFKLHGMDYHGTPLGTSTAPYRDARFVGYFGETPVPGTNAALPSPLVLHLRIKLTRRSLTGL